MAILTVVGTPEKDQNITLQISKSDLKANSKVAADGYFSDESSWYRIIINYLSSYGGNQQFSFSFDASESVPEVTKKLDYRFKGNLEFNSLKIVNFNGSELTIYRSEITPAEFDIDCNLLTPPTPLISAVSNQNEFTVASTTNLVIGDRVRLYNTSTLVYSEFREISNIVGSTIVVSSDFSTTIIANTHELHFANRDDCNVRQQGYFELP